jgi:hypothetical protein
MKNRIRFGREPVPRKIGGILVPPWQEFLARLWDDAH